jgi:Na+/H+ antiporter NhaD/arsenite permease-like protein
VNDYEEVVDGKKMKFRDTDLSGRNLFLVGHAVSIAGKQWHSNAHETSIVAHAILIGVDLGPDLSVTGSLATILWLIAPRREKVEITVWEFFKIGAIAMPVALIASLLFLWN